MQLYKLIIKLLGWFSVFGFLITLVLSKGFFPTSIILNNTFDTFGILFVIYCILRFVQILNDQKNESNNKGNLN